MRGDLGRGLSRVPGKERRAPHPPRHLLHPDASQLHHVPRAA